MARGHSAGQMMPVATGLSLTSNCRRSPHKVRPCPLDLAQEKVSSFRSDFAGLPLLNRVFQTASLHALDLPYKSPAVFGTLSTEVIHYSYFPPFIDTFCPPSGLRGSRRSDPKEGSLASALRSRQLKNQLIRAHASKYLHVLRAIASEDLQCVTGTAALLTRDLSSREWSKRHASTDKHLWAPLSLIYPRFRKLRWRTGRVRHNLGVLSRANQIDPPRPVIPAAFPCLRQAYFGTFSGDVSQKGYNG
jgi:hypothetical protein